MSPAVSFDALSFFLHFELILLCLTNNIRDKNFFVFFKYAKSDGSDLSAAVHSVGLIVSVRQNRIPVRQFVPLTY